MLTDAIKQQILSLAIRGKLTDQRPEDGSAEELYRSIREEKKRLIKAGKLKKEKPLPPIMEEEIPFDIPENWKWVRFGEIINIINGDRGRNYPAKSKLRDEGKIPFISALNIENNTISKKELLYLSEGQYKNLSSGKLQQKDIVLCIRGSLGKCGVFPYNQGAIASSLVIIRRVLECNLTYLLSYLQADLFHDMIHTYNNGTAQPNLSAGNLALFRFPLPPLPEQERIASKLEAVMTALQDLEGAKTRAQAIKTELRKSLLQEAIQGKLTDQRPEDGSAEDLYRAILAEKKRLIKASKLKKEKPLPPIEEKDIPFDIPENWKWVRLGEVAMRISKGTTPRGASAVYKNEGIGFLRAENIAGGDCLDLSNLKYIDNETHTGALSRSILQANDILITIAGTLGRTGLVRQKDLPLNANQAVSFVRPLPTATPCISFFCIALNAPIIQRKLTRQERVTAIPNLTLEMISSCVIPLPPLAEQERIVAKLEELLPLCD